MLTMADKGGRGSLDPPFFADIICEQPLFSMDMFASLVFIFTKPNVKLVALFFRRPAAIVLKFTFVFMI